MVTAAYAYGTAVLVVLFAAAVATMIARAVNDRSPLPPAESRIPHWVPGPDSPTLGIPVGLARAAAAEGERCRALAAGRSR